MIRLSKDAFFINLCVSLSTQGTCCRRQTGCVIINKYYEIMSTGYNGPPSGYTHCERHGWTCNGANYPSGQGLSECEAIHAEANALLKCTDIHSIHTLYCTASPCFDCIKLISNTSCKRIVFLEPYTGCNRSEEFFCRHDKTREWVHYVAKS